MPRSKAKPRILYAFFQTGDQSNGGVVSLLSIAKSLKNYEPVFVTQLRTQRSEALSKQYRVFYGNRLEFSYRILKPLTLVFWNVYFIYLIVRYRISIVHINDNIMVWRAFFAIKLFRKKWVVNIRGVFEPQKRYGKNRVWVNYCDHIVVLSHEMKKHLSERLPYFKSRRKIIEQQMKVIYSIVKPQGTAADLQLPGFDGHRAHVLFVAAFNNIKNQLNFIRQAMPRLKSLDVVVHFVGDFNPDHNAYARQCHEALVELDLLKHVVLHGFQKNIEAFYKQARLTLVPSRQEGLARCMIESLVCGTPVISFDVCSAHELLTGYSCGVVVGQGNYEQLCSAIEKLIHDSEQLHTMGDNGRRLRSCFAEETIVNQYEQLYESL